MGTPKPEPKLAPAELSMILARLAAVDEKLAALTAPPPPAFDPLDTLVVICTYPSGQAHPAIFAALEANGIPKTAIQISDHRDTVGARNASVRDQIFPSGKSTAILFDADMIPGKATERFWKTPGDIVGAYYPSGDLRHWENGNVHCGMMRVNVEVFQTLPAPWFQLTRDAYGANMLQCEGNYLTSRARAAGFTVKQAGFCAHSGKHEGCTQPY